MPRQDHLDARKGKRLDIQGLRALAVTLVVVFHLFPANLPGGYIGVDIFFVISGFLITGHLLREVETRGRIRVTEFWAKRVRRLLPASLLVLLATVLLTMTVMPENTRTQNYGDIGYAAGYILNWRLAANSVDYLNSAVPPSLVQHFWSLSVEEQFYLVWPILIAVALGIAALLKRPSRRFLLTLLVLVFLASFVFSIVETARSQPSAYFLTTTRAWEFALGGLVSMIPAFRTNAAVRGITSVIALVTISACAFLFGQATAFPGAIALVPVAATAILIWAGETPRDSSDAWKFAPQRLTHNRAVQFLGDSSYSVYLWHWPLILTVAALAPDFAEWQHALLTVPTTLFLAWLTLKYVENPVRRSTGLLAQRGLTFALTGAVVAVILGVTTAQTVAIEQQLAQRQAELESPLAGPDGKESDTSPLTGFKNCLGAYAILNGCEDPHAYDASRIDATLAQEDKPWRWLREKVQQDECTQTTVGSLPERSCDFPGSGKQVLLIGDSHSDQLMRPLQRIADSEGWGLRLESRSACALFTPPGEGQDENTARCAEWGANQLDSIVADPDIDVVIISVRVSDSAQTIDPRPGLMRLRDAGKQVIVIRDIPPVGLRSPDGERLTGPECLISQGASDDACSWPAEDGDDWLSEAASELDISVIDTHTLLCPEGTCHMLIGGVVVYTDDNHLTGMFALSMEGWLAKELEPLLR